MEDTGENGGDGRHMGCTLFWSFHGRTGNGAGIATVLGWFAMVRPDDREGRRKGKRNSSSVLLWLVDGAAVRPRRSPPTRISSPFTAIVHLLAAAFNELLRSCSGFDLKMRDRLILEKVNAAINDMASYAEANAYIREVEAF
ncbi:hypothetical protein Ahy_B09g099838 isoform B [Arachis hypogaea]|uniref:Uncharacterized protein n=1 Tax=Arachis hypogaea TaxID=3818 RepID=A0A444XV13_ARAHY|nr:hypothetical protein Ahy_B09g099838 isoform B [Arachis hypogaea]